MPAAEWKDDELVSRSLSGNREAFGEIVARYQSLICSLAYSATGNLGQSEDLAQETFVTAWQQLEKLSEPAKLRSWLCGIARNLIGKALRRQGREPAHGAESLEAVSEAPTAENLPPDYVITKEEEGILWRSLEQIPELYREPLVLFYREQQSVETVAQKLELSEDTVKQRLSRGRKLLHEQVAAFVEGALARTNAGKAFTVAVLASLPAMSFSAKAATLGTAAVKGGATAKAAGATGWFNLLLGPLFVVLPTYLGYRIGLATTQTEEERAGLKALFGKVAAISVGLFIPFVIVVLWLTRNQTDRAFLPGFLATGLTLIYLPTFWGFAIASSRRSRQYYSAVVAQKYGGVLPRAAWEFRSRAVLLGLPLVHIRIGDRFGALKEPVKAWIAVGGNAIGGLFAFGGTAVAPVAVGGLSIGWLSLGGLSVGAVALGGIALGIWPLFGGVIIGWQAFGGCVAIAWNAAAGEFALAHGFALGQFARAAEVNTDRARQIMEANVFWRSAMMIARHWVWLNLIWVVAFLVQWRVARRGRSEGEKV